MALVGAPGIRLNCEIVGDGPPLVLHHGFAGCAEDWSDFGIAPYLKDRFRLIIVDGLGHGASDKPYNAAAYEPRNRVAALVAALDALGLDRVHYYGHSYGGHFGYALAAFAPQRFRSLVISAAHPFPASGQGWRSLLEMSMDAFLERCDQIYGTWMTPARRARLASIDRVALGFASPDRPELTDGLRSLSVPTLFVCGEADPAFSPVQAADVVGMTPRGQSLIYPGFGHVDLFGRPDVVQPDILRFLGMVEESRS